MVDVLQPLLCTRKSMDTLMIGIKMGEHCVIIIISVWGRTKWVYRTNMSLISTHSSNIISDRYSDDFETIKTSIADTVPEGTIFSDEDLQDGRSTESSLYSSTFQDFTHQTTTKSAFSTRQYSDDSSKSVYTSESTSTRYD